MVKLNLENDGFQRNPSHGFVAVGSPSRKVLDDMIGLFEKTNENYDWKDHPTPKIMRNVLITPIALNKKRSLVKNLKALKEQGYVDNVMFDSGGFQVLTGSLEDKGITTLADLQKHNQQIYNEEDWADIYIMPDYPSSKDDHHRSLANNEDHLTFEDKSKRTIEATLDFFECLSPTVQGKVAPVFHLQKDVDIEFYYQEYKPILDVCKFASYSASSLTRAGAARQLTREVLQVLKALVDKLTPENIGLHCLGLAAPANVFALNYLGVKAYDASTPVIGAGLGKVFFPYYGAASCSMLRDDEELNLNAASLKNYREKSGHFCPLCEDIDILKSASNEHIPGMLPGYMYRRLHNMIVLDELNWHYRDFNFDTLKEASPLMHKNLTSVLNLTKQSTFL